MFTVLALVLGVGVVARAALQDAKPSVLWSCACATVGWVACFAGARLLFGAEEQRLFSLECLIPALLLTLALLWLLRRYVLNRRHTVFY